MRRINSVTYNGVTSTSLGVFVGGAGAYGAAALDITKYEIPGRNGDLIIPNNRWKNITIAYPAFIPSDFEIRVQMVRNWLTSSRAYARLEDTYDADHFRLAIMSEEQEFEPVQFNAGANFQLVFDCKPQRFLLTGETPKAMTSGQTITNPTQFEARPLISVVNPTIGATIRVGTYRLTCVKSYTGTVSIDCETRNIFAGLNNLNSYFTVTGGDFPALAPGANTVTFTGVSSLTIIPRWWEL